MRKYDNSEKRTWLIPYMGDASYVGAAGLRHFGVNSTVLATNTQRGYEVARKHIYTEVCHPLKGVVGDAIGFLQEEIERKGKEYVENHYLVMIPTTSGPCRFGKYVELVREFLDREGLQKVPAAGPSSESDYQDIPFPGKLSSSQKTKMQQMLFKGIKGSDLLEDITLRFRPYAVDRGQVEELKAQRLSALEKVVENGAEIAEMVAWGAETVARFREIKLREDKRFPLVLYIGEIYMRQHDPYTNFVVHKLEKQGLEIVRDPVIDWLDYVNKMNIRNNKRDIGLAIKSFNLSRMLKVTKKYAQAYLKGRYMSSVEDKIAEPFHEVLKGRHVLPKPIDMIETLERNQEGHGNIEGESPLSTSIAYHLMNDLVSPVGDACISGIYHVGPFTCMQEGVATAKIEAMAKELRKKKPDLVFPIIHAYFGDSASANLESEIAVFTEQCYQKREVLMEKYGMKAPSPRTPERMVIKAVSAARRTTESLTRAEES